MSFTQVTDGDTIDDEDINQYKRALEGEAGHGVAIRIVQVDDSGNYALDVCNIDSVNGLQLRVRDSAKGTNLFLITDDGITFGEDVTVASGKTIGGVLPSHHHTGGTDGPPIATGAFAEGAIVPADILNRTRYFLVRADGETVGLQGVSLGPTDTHSGYANFIVPADLASDTTVTVQGVFSGQGLAGTQYRVGGSAKWGALTEAYDATEVEVAAMTAVQAEAQDDLEVLTDGATSFNMTLTGAVAGDIVSLTATRYGNHADDDGARYLYLVGFLVTYTADS